VARPTRGRRRRWRARVCGEHPVHLARPSIAPQPQGDQAEHNSRLIIDGARSRCQEGSGPHRHKGSGGAGGDEGAEEGLRGTHGAYRTLGQGGSSARRGGAARGEEGKGKGSGRAAGMPMGGGTRN